MPRSKQPNDSDHFSDTDQRVENMDMEWSSSAAAEGDPFLLAARSGEVGSGGGLTVTEEGRLSPADFSTADLALARDLHSLFSLEQEQLPPDFIQTLTTQSRTWDAPDGLTQRVNARVFQRLQVSPRLFKGAPQAPVEGPRGVLFLRRAPQRIALGTLLAVVLLSLVTVAPSFAQGLRMLLGYTGVQMVPHYPQTTIVAQEQMQPLSPLAVQQAVPFTVSWPGPTPASYQFMGLVLHIGQPWADGPVVELQYTHGNPQTGFGPLIVREFRPKAKATVLQVVAQGAAHQVQIGNQQAIYIDGQWIQRHMAIVWEYGTRAELIYQSGGVIFWITADQRDGTGEAILEDLAMNLSPLYLGQMRRMLPEPVAPVNAQVASALSSASLGEVIALIPAGTSPETGAAVFIAEGSPLEDDV